MNNKKIDYVIVISALFLIAGISTDNKVINIISFSILLISLLLKKFDFDIPIVKKKVKKTGKTNKTSSRKVNIDKIKYFRDDINNWLNEDELEFADEYNYYENNVCANCGCVLDTKITSSKTCKFCNKKIVLRTNKITSKKLFLSEERAREYDRHDKKRSEILFFENIIAPRISIYEKYMNEFYRLKDKGYDPRNVVWPFISYVGGEMDRMAYKEFMKIVNLPEKRMAEESFEIIRKFFLANTQYYIMAEIADYKEQKDIAMNLYADCAYRAVQITILDDLSNPFQELKVIDYMNNINIGKIFKFLKNNEYSIEDFKNNFIERRHPFILPQFSNEKSWEYVEEAINLYKRLDNNNR